MSRTFRRVNFEKTEESRKNHRSGWKIGGYYTTYDTHERTGNGHNDGYCPIYRPMTQEERTELYWSIHGESKHNNAWGPNWYYRKMAERQLRTRNNLELRKAMADFEYEGLFESIYPYGWDLSWW